MNIDIKKLKPGKKLMFCILSCILTAVVLEIACFCILKIMGRSPYDRIGGIEGHLDNVYFFKGHHYYALEANPEYPGIKINSFGLRGPEIQTDKADNEYRIACLGGSTTMTLTNEDELTYPVLLEKQLRGTYPDKTINVINGGIGTYTSAESLIAYMFKISYLDPDLILIYHGINDIFPEAYYSDNYPDYRQHRKIFTDRKAVFPRWFLRGMKFSNLLKLIYRKVFPEEPHIWEYSLYNTQRNDKQALINIKKKNFGRHYRRNMQRLIEAAVADGVEVLLITVRLNKKSPDSWVVGAKKNNEILRELARKNKVMLFDLEKHLERHPASDNIFFDNCHFTAYGNNLRVKAISDYLISSSIIEDVTE